MEILIGLGLLAFGVLIMGVVWRAGAAERRRADRYAADFGVRRLPNETTPELMRRVREKITIRGYRR